MSYSFLKIFDLFLRLRKSILLKYFFIESMFHKVEIFPIIKNALNRKKRNKMSYEFSNFEIFKFRIFEFLII